MEEFLTSAQLADLLQLSPDTVKYWRTQCRGPAYHTVGNHVRYRRSDVDSWLRKHLTTTLY